jgi:hypothetical protein
VDSSQLDHHLEELLSQGAAAVWRIAADREGNKGRAQYTARIGRVAQALPEPVRQTQAQHEAEM